MKLNNKGWGTLEMILISGALLIALIVSIYYIAKLYGSYDLSNSNRIYMDLETKLEGAARKYIKENNIQNPSQYHLSLNVLQSGGFIGELKDKNNRNCDGYVIVNEINNVNYYKAYISCQDYVTINY